MMQKFYRYNINVLDYDNLVRRIIFDEKCDELLSWLQENTPNFKVIFVEFDKPYISFRYKKEFIKFKLTWI